MAPLLLRERGSELPDDKIELMTLQEFTAAGESVGAKAGVLDGLQGCFRCHAPRLHQACERFGLFSDRLGDVLEIGPFYGYMPFVLRPRSSSYTVLETTIRRSVRWSRFIGNRESRCIT
jgi:hypothetical protein